MNERTIFMAALDIDDLQQRTAYLDMACQGDAELRQRVDQLFNSHDSAGSFLQEAANSNEVTVDLMSHREMLGTQIGPYKLLQQIGEGGMGVVYMAEQREPVKRRVALKIIKPGMDTRQVIARFEAERQALALLDHPNIAKVLEAGATDSGRPYFVMELVNGIPITEYCDEHQLTLPERLQLFIPVCHAIQHSHQKGIIHRDLKPSNILVAEYDHVCVPKVIDFGVAKATNQTLTEKTMFTQFGQIIGTVEYMSPEQAKRNQLDIDTRSDVYSLGVILYELLTGETPLDRERLRASAFDEMLRVVREEEPLRPSTRVSTSATRGAVAAKRSTEPAKLTGLIRGELDWIVMKSLEKDRNRRYGTACAFADDLSNHLAGSAVTACPPSVTYRFGKFAKRNKAAIASLALLFTVVLLGLFGTSWQAIRALRAEVVATEAQRVAVDERDRANEKVVEVQMLLDRQQTLLDQLVSEIRRKALVCAMNADMRGTEQAIAQAKAVGVPLGWEHVIRGQLYVSRGEPDAAAEHLEQALQLNPESVVAQYLHSEVEKTLNCAIGTPANDNMWKWLDVEPDSPESKLLLDTAYLYMGQAERALAGTTEYLQQYNNGVGRRFRAEALLQLATEQFDKTLVSRAERDFIVVSELMPDSAQTYFTGIRVHLIGYQLELAAGNKVEAARHRAEGLDLCARIKRFRFPPLHGVAALFCDCIGDVASASAHWRSAYDNGANGYWLGYYACFLCRNRVDYQDEFAKVLAELDKDDVWTGCQRIMLGLDEADVVKQPAEEMLRLASSDFPIIVRAWPIRMLFFLGRGDLGQPLAEEVLAESKEPLIDWMRLEFECLAGRRSASSAIEQVTGSTSLFLRASVAAKLVCDGERPAGMKVLETIEKDPYGDPFRDFLVTLLTRMRSDDSWPRQDSDNADR